MLAVISIGKAPKKNGFKRYNHQRRLKEKYLQKFSKKILKQRNRLLKVKNFDELYIIISSCAVKGIGELTIYDIASRIGEYQRIFPTKVYLHAGTRKGAIALRINEAHYSKFIYKNDVPKPLQTLKPYQIEDFLCLYKKLRSK